MNPILFDNSTMEFNTNGIGILADAVSCYIESSFGSEELKMQYPVKGQFFSEIGMRSIILAKPERNANPQPYRVYKITKPMSGIVTIYARHLCYDLMGVALKPFSAPSATVALQGLKENAVSSCPFEFWTDKTVASTFTVPIPTSIWQSLAGVEWSILATYGGEYAFDGNTVKLYTRRGTDNGVSIRYGKNLTSLEQDENCANCYTGVMPYWQDSETGEISALPEYVINAEGDFGYTKILPLDLTGEFDTQPTPEQLRQRAARYMTDNRIGEPVVSWKVSFVQLEQSEEYRGQRFLEQVSLGDTVSVYFSAMGVKASARVVKAKFDCLLDRFDTVTLGSVKQSLASTIVDQKKAIDAKPSMSALDAAVGAATSSILGAAGGAVRLLDTDGDGQLDTLYIADDPDPLKAQKVWRYNYEGWGASTTGYAGTFTMAATLNAGIVADMITSGVLNANLIQTGTIRSTDGRIIIDLDAGTVQIKQVTDQLDSIQDNLPAQIVDEMTKSEAWAMLQDNITDIRTTTNGLEIEVPGISKNLNGFLDLFHTYFKVAADGLHIAASDSEFETLLGNSKLSFIQAGAEVAYIQYNRLYITEAWVKNGMAIGNPDGGKYTRMYVDGNGVWCLQIMGE